MTQNQQHGTTTKNKMQTQHHLRPTMLHHARPEDYHFPLNCCPIWDKPSYATFTNPFKIAPPDFYVECNPLKISPEIQKKKLDPTFTKYFEQLTQANKILCYWIDLHVHTEEKAETENNHVQQWRVTAIDLTNNEQFNSNWEVPAYFKWYKQDIAESSQAFFEYIFNDYYIPFAIGRAANADWQQALCHWEEKATQFHNNNSHPSQMHSP